MPRATDYVPLAGDGIPSYFYAMLDDVDRLSRYSLAIQLCLQEVPVAAPVVIDVGVGTGVLSALALLHGAHLVVGVDVNDAALRAATSAMTALGYKDRFVAIKVSRSASTAAILRAVQDRLQRTGTTPFDVIVSEILGTLVYGESMRTYLKKYLPLVRMHRGRIFAVPMRCRQYFGVYSFSAPSSAVKNAVESAMDAAHADNEYVPTDQGGIGVPLHVLPAVRIAEQTRIYDADFTAPDAPYRNPEVNVGLPRVTRRRVRHELVLGVFEWRCELWTDVWLRNTLQEYQWIERTLGLQAALARNSAWGFMACNLRGVGNVNVRYAENRGTRVRLEAVGAAARTLDAVCDIGRFHWTSSATDSDLARRLADRVADAEADIPSTVIWIVDDVTCGSLTLRIARRFKKASIVVLSLLHASELQRVVARTLRDVSTVEVVPTQGRNRRPQTPGSPTCMVFPGLCYMHLDHRRRSELYAAEALRVGLSGRSHPSLNDLHTIAVNTRRFVPRVFNDTLQAVADVTGATAQFKPGIPVHVTTRDFQGPMFWSEVRMSTDDLEVLMNVNAVEGDDELAANPATIARLLEDEDVLSAVARMTSGSGLICRAGLNRKDRVELIEDDGTDTAEDST